MLSIRAVKIDTSTLLSLQAFIKPGGHLLNFAAGSDPVDPPPPLRLRAVHTLIPENQSRLVVIQKQRIGATFHVKHSAVELPRSDFGLRP